MELENIVPWGRSFAEYQAMFKLSDSDLQKHILGCGDGPASFNSVLTKRGGNITSFDPIYEFTAPQIQSRINNAYDDVLAQVEKIKQTLSGKI